MQLSEVTFKVIRRNVSFMTLQLYAGRKNKTRNVHIRNTEERSRIIVAVEKQYVLRICLRMRAGARVRGRVQSRACMYPCSSSMQQVCAIL
jgi:hypothetical protein